MIKKYKRTLILTSSIILLPIIAGIILWNRLPEQMVTHFGADNAPDGFSSKAFAVFGLPCVLLALHWICMLITAADPKSKNIHGKALSLVLWVCPSISLLMGGITYSYALNNEIRVGMIIILFMGVLFIVLGNYMPKCKQNYTFGIKLPWTLNDEENWNRTHRFAGKLWVICGVLVCVTAIFENPFVFMGIVLLAVIIPTAYSFSIYKNKRK